MPFNGTHLLFGSSNRYANIIDNHVRKGDTCILLLHCMRYLLLLLLLLLLLVLLLLLLLLLRIHACMHACMKPQNREAVYTSVDER